jgi:hypothetical protein
VGLLVPEAYWLPTTPTLVVNGLEILTAGVVWIQDQEPDQTGMGMGLDEGRGYLMFPVLVL